MSDRLPNAADAQIGPGKLRDYALNPKHDTGRYKAAFFVEFVNPDGSTRALLTLAPSQVRRLSPADVLTTRQMDLAA